MKRLGLSWLWMLLFLATSSLPAGAQTATATLSGRVLDFKTGEPIARALVAIRAQKLQTVTRADGTFDIPEVTPGEVELYVSTVDYGLLKERIVIPAGKPMQVELLLGQESLRHSENLTVSGGPFAAVEADAASEYSLQNTEIQNLSTVLISDPMRSLQSVPGATANDDFYAQFAVRGAGFQKLGVYIDGVLTTALFHTVQGDDDAYSLTVLNGDMVESMSLISGPYPARYGDRIGGVLAIQTREGSRDRVMTHADINMLGAGASSEGPLGKRGSWLVAARKSFLGYLLKRTDARDLGLGYLDVQGKLAWQLTDRHHLAVTSIAGRSGVDLTQETEVGSVASARNANEILDLQWTWTPDSSTVSEASAFFSRETSRNRNFESDLLGRWDGGQFGFREDFMRQLAPWNSVEAGVSVRRVWRESATSADWNPLTNWYAGSLVEISRYSRNLWQPGAYAQDTWQLLNRRVTVTAGVRFDHLSITGQNVTLPRASITFPVLPNTKMWVAVGQYAQFPDFEELFGPFGTPTLAAERSTYAQMGLEHRLSDNLRFRAEAYNRQERDVIFSPLADFRLDNGIPRAPTYGPVLRNSLRGYSRGIELTLQKRSANRLSGWLTYNRGFTRYRDAASGLGFWGDYDQRHTFALFTTYRVTPSVNVSGSARYGSGYPIRGYLIRPPGYTEPPGVNWRVYALSDVRNTARVPAYSRVDLRINKAFYREHWKLTLFAEVDNLLGHDNWRYPGFSPYGYTQGWVTIQRDTMLPFIPTAGVSMEF